MSNFPDAVADGRRSGKAPEKSNFSQTCSLLSQFLKEKRTSGAPTLGMGGKMEPEGTQYIYFFSLLFFSYLASFSFFFFNHCTIFQYVICESNFRCG